MADQLAIGEPRANRSGGKSASITLQSGKPVVITTTAPLIAPFGASLFNEPDAVRVNIDYGQLEGLEPQMRSLDEQVIKAAVAARDSLWPGKGLTPEQVRENYTSPLKEREGYSTTLRTKLQLDKCHCWSWDGARIPMPEGPSPCKGCQVQPKIAVQSLWFMAGNKFGATFLTTDLRIQEPVVDCPW
jgi:hypothetical protein